MEGESGAKTYDRVTIEAVDVGATVFTLQQTGQKSLVSRLSHILSDIGPTDKQGPTRGGVSLEMGTQFGRERGITDERIAVVTLQPKYHVDEGIAFEGGLAVLDGFRRTTGDAVALGSGDGLGVGTDIVEVVARYELAYQRVVGIAESPGPSLPILKRSKQVW